MKTSQRSITRRTFMRQACCAAVGTTGLLSAMAQLRLLGAVAADSVRSQFSPMALPGDFKAMVCVYLGGGNDATNMIIPSDGSNYAFYAKARAELAVPQSALLPMSLRKYSDGRSYALHPSIPEIQSLFSQGKIAFLANVGTLVQPTTLNQYNAGQGLPTQLFSHNDQGIQWQSSIPDQPFTTGWGGRLADLLNGMNSNNQISMSISLSGANWFERGNQVIQFAVSSAGFPSLTTASLTQLRATQAALQNILNASPSNMLDAAFRGVTTTAISDNALLGSLLPTAPVLKTAFPNSPMGSDFAMIARLISLAPQLGLKRQIFFVGLNGFDLHAAQVDGHGPLLAELSGALKAFYDATVELGVANQVTTFTASDFGRTYVPNAGGTDHGWGNHQLIMGGAVQGGDIYGKMPSLVVGADDDTGRGRWIPSTSVDEYSATLATWFGVSASNLSTVLPNIGRFAHPNLGFMG